jgi:biotin carboxyl carrier protein
MRALAVSRHPDGAWSVRGDGLLVNFSLWAQEGMADGVVRVHYARDNAQSTAYAALREREVHVDIGARSERFTETLPEPKGRAASGTKRLLAPMSGKVVAVQAQLGAQVSKGQCLLVVEAMKIQHEIAATGPGKVTALPVRVGDQVASRQLLAELELSG